MHATARHLGATAAWLLLGGASAVPAAAGGDAPVYLAARSPPSPTDPWVTVDLAGNPKTITPVVSTVSGSTTILSGAPHDLTATLYTRTSLGEISTSTGDPPLPTATAAKGGPAGAFPVCHNLDGPGKPFCSPTDGADLYPGTTYYVTWDPTFFNETNSTVQITANYFNSTSGDLEENVFDPYPVLANWSYYAWPVDAKVLSTKKAKSVNVTLSIAKLQAGTGAKLASVRGPTVLVRNPPVYHQPPTKAPDREALVVALPTVLGFVVVVLVGTCLWNRKTRRIDVGSIMGRARHGYGVRKSRRQRVGKDQGIRLMDRDPLAAGRPRDDFDDDDDDAHRGGSGLYRDDDDDDDLRAARARGGGWREEIPGRRDEEARELDLPRRDSDALGSLAGTPTEDRRMDFGRLNHRGGNAFRDELSRQDRERV